MDAAELKPLVSDWGYWKTCVDDTVAVPQQANVRHNPFSFTVLLMGMKAT